MLPWLRKSLRSSFLWLWRKIVGVIDGWLFGLITLGALGLAYKFRDRLQAFWERFTN